MDILTADVHRNAWVMLKVIFAKMHRAISDRHWDEDEAEWNDYGDYLAVTDIEAEIMGQIVTLQTDKTAVVRHSPFLSRAYHERVEGLYELDRYLDQIKNSILAKNVSRLRSAFETLSAACDEQNIDLWNYFEGAEACLDQLSINETELIYLPRQNLIAIPSLILEVHDGLMSQIAKTPEVLFQISPRKFEEVIAELFHKKGFHVELTRMTCDGGKDIIAVHEHFNIRTKYIIECKRYAQTNKVSLGLVQRLLGVKISEAANKAILATTSTFTRTARAFASNHLWDLDLKDYDDIVKWIRSV